MTQDVSGFGLSINLIASVTFPTGFLITQFSEDVDPLDMNSIDIADAVMGLNGDLITWAKAVALNMVVAVIPGSDDDQNLQIIFDANRPAQGKASVQDSLTATVVYPDGTSVTLIGGKMISGMPGRSVAGSGRQKTKVYGMRFQTKVGG
jgi:tail fiber protein gp32